MNDTLEKALAGIINQAVSGIDSASVFLMAQLPDVIRQLLLWNFALSLVKMAIDVLVIICGVLVIKSALKTNDDYVYVPVSMGAFVVCFVVTVCTFNFTWLQIWIAPKIWLMEYAANLIKGH